MIKLLIILIMFNLNQFLNPNHIDLFKNTDPELIVYGGADAGKSYSIADKLLLNLVHQNDRPIKIVVMRKTLPSLRRSALDILTKRAETLRFPFDLNKSEWTATCNNIQFLFLSLDNKEDYQKLKSLTDVDYIWINEANELREDDYEECLRRMRGGKAKFEQIIIDFNPIGKFTWIYKRFWQKNIGNVKKLHYTILDNHPDYLKTKKAQRYLQRLKKTKEHNYNYYIIYFLGEWGELKGIIFDWDVVKFPNIKFDSVFYGGDFGYSVDPAALIKIYRKADEYWLDEKIYEKGLTNPQLANRMKDAEADEDFSYWDSAEPKSIQELFDLDVNAYPAIKGPDSVRAGIDFLKELKIHIIEGSENIIKEARSYVYKIDKDGNALPIPIDFNDHAMSATRYGIYTDAKEGGILPGSAVI